MTTAKTQNGSRLTQLSYDKQKTESTHQQEAKVRLKRCREMSERSRQTGQSLKRSTSSIPK